MYASNLSNSADRQPLQIPPVDMHLIFTACVTCRNPVWNRQKIKCRSTGGLFEVHYTRKLQIRLLSPRPTQYPVWLVQILGQESKTWASFRGSQKQESKNNHNSTIFGAKDIVRNNLLWEKLNSRKTNRIFYVQWNFVKLWLTNLVGSRHCRKPLGRS